MRRLYHLWLSPFSRKVRLALAEKHLEAELVSEPVWERRPEFLALNPAGTVPVFIDEDGTRVADSQPICEYLEDCWPDRPLIGREPSVRAEVRRVTLWFDLKFHQEVTRYLVDEKVMKRFMKMGEPNSSALRAGRANIGYHLDYIAYLIENRNWLAGDLFSLADIAAASQLSCLDYLGDVPWADHEGAKDWYARVKSRPSFRPLLKDRIPGLPPPKHYDDLDF
ncbi:MAG: glutathione S-transferase family protein [Alphaproteobacteria bacterium]